MRFPLIASALAALCLALPTTAQNGGGVKVFGGASMRACSSLVLFGSNIMAGITITHGQPAWKDEYSGLVDTLKGNNHRLGSDLWTTFMTNVPVEIGGVTVPPGSYVVGLHCDKDGKFGLAMLDATKAMKANELPFTNPHQWQPDVLTPLTLNKDASEKPVEKMLITMKADEKDPMTGTLTLAWGPHTLTAKMKVHPAK